MKLKRSHTYRLEAGAAAAAAYVSACPLHIREGVPFLSVTLGGTAILRLRPRCQIETTISTATHFPVKTGAL